MSTNIGPKNPTLTTTPTPKGTPGQVSAADVAALAKPAVPALPEKAATTLGTPTIPGMNTDSVGGTPGKPSAPLKVAKYGETGAQVASLQQALAANGFPVTKEKGYGANTVDAVKKFQKEMGLESEGIAGPQTRATLQVGRKLKEAEQALNDAALGCDSPELVAKAQDLLKQAGTDMAAYGKDLKLSGTKLGETLAELKCRADGAAHELRPLPAPPPVNLMEVLSATGAARTSEKLMNPATPSAQRFESAVRMADLYPQALQPAHIDAITQDNKSAVAALMDTAEVSWNEGILAQMPQATRDKMMASLQADPMIKTEERRQEMVNKILKVSLQAQP